MTEEYQRGFADAKDAIGKLIACASASLAGMTLIAEVGTDDLSEGGEILRNLGSAIEAANGWLAKFTPRDCG